MVANGLRGSSPSAAWSVPTRGGGGVEVGDTAPSPDRLDRDFNAERPDQRRMTDRAEFGCPMIGSVMVLTDLFGLYGGS